jgi:hypothetical protein
VERMTPNMKYHLRLSQGAVEALKDLGEAFGGGLSLRGVIEIISRAMRNALLDHVLEPRQMGFLSRLDVIRLQSIRNCRESREAERAMGRELQCIDSEPEEDLPESLAEEEAAASEAPGEIEEALHRGAEELAEEHVLEELLAMVGTPTEPASYPRPRRRRR